MFGTLKTNISKRKKNFKQKLDFINVCDISDLIYEKSQNYEW